MSVIHGHIQSLEALAQRSGARLQRCALPEFVQGRLRDDEISLRAGLTPEQELCVLVHELAHWFAHAGMRAVSLSTTLCEYEAEAVEGLVLARLGLCESSPGLECIHYERPTDGLLSASVARVTQAGEHICAALGLPRETPRA